MADNADFPHVGADVNNVLAQIRARAKEAPAIGDEIPAAQRKEEWAKKKDAANIPPRYSACSFDGIQRKGVPLDCRTLYQEAKAYADHFPEESKTGKGLILAGSAGRLKTTLAVAIMQQVMQQGGRAYFVSMPELLDTLLTMGKNKDPQELRKFEDKIRTVGLLVLDDFGAEYPSGWVLNKVDAIITHRYNHLLPVVITTNLRPDEMAGRYVARVVDRLRSAYQTIIVDGQSLRPGGGFAKDARRA